MAFFIPAIILILGIAVCFFVFISRKSTWVSHVDIALPSESAENFRNPKRGGYYICGFTIDDAMDNLESNVRERVTFGKDTSITLVEVNLSRYSHGDISEEGLSNLHSVFSVMAQENRHYIIRFLYDWDGEVFRHEPKNIGIILRHMKQVAPIVNEFKDCSYTLQGLFIGNWGEMNGSRYTTAEDLQLLAGTLAKETDSSIKLSVRTPALLRMLTDASSPVCDELKDRLGLFNDGMFGNEQDYGTYGSNKAENQFNKPWIRSKEIEYQDEVCRTVLNGGEVLSGSAYSEFSRAADDLRRMHVSYLNLDYDSKLWEEWENVRVSEEGVFDGCSGKEYILSHLGYRFVMTGINAVVKPFYNKLIVRMNLQNIGFAPIYEEPSVLLILQDGETKHTVPFSGSIRSICNGESAVAQAEADLSELPKGEYELLVEMRLRDGSVIHFGNDCEEACAVGVIRP